MTQKSDKSIANKQISLSPEQQRVMAYISVSLILVLAFTLLFWNTVIVAYNESRFNQKLAEFTQEQANHVIDYKKNISEILIEFTNNPLTVRWLNQREISTDYKAAMAEIQQNILTTIPYSKEVRFYYPGQAQEEKDKGGSIGFVELNMINRAEKNARVFPEAALIKDNADSEIHWVSAIYETKETKPANETPIAILHVTTAIEGLKETLSHNEVRLARTEVIQKIQLQRQLKFLTLGEGGGFGSQIIDIAESHWQLEISPSKFFVKRTSNTPLWVMALLALIAAPSVWLAYYLAERKNSQLASLYKTLDIKLPGADKQNKETEEQEDKLLDNPIYLTDKQLEVTEEDQALVTGAHQQKQNSSEASTTLTSTTQGLLTPDHIFRAYDIRGEALGDLTEELVQAIGKAIATEALEQGEDTLLVGYDARTHSPQLRDQLNQGIISTGCNVIDIGLGPTPLLNFATHFCDQTSSGIIVTASHNPKQYNGFKIVLDEKSLVADDMQRIRQRINTGAFIVNKKKPGSITSEDFTEDYIDTIAADIAINSDMRIVIDAANGASSELAPAAFKELGCEVIPLYCEFDGEFPNHEPDPSIESNLQALISQVQEAKADLGIALDGDGDRLVVVTGSGIIIWPDQLLMLFARDVVSRNPGCDVIFDIKCTRHLNQVISNYGGRPVMWKTGHSNIKSKMRENNALLAGEFSGHIFFKERWFGFDDGIYAAARLLEIMSLRDQSLDDMLTVMPTTVSTSEIRVPVPEASKFSLVEKLMDVGEFSSGEKTTIDGLRVDFAKGWGLIRASNTEPALTLRFEAENEKGIEQLKTLFKRELDKIDSSLSLDF